MQRFAYLDSSAVAKLFLPEPERSALESALLEKRGLFTSRLALTECGRIVTRLGREVTDAFIEDVFGPFVLIDLSSDILRAASGVLPSGLRSIDAIHVVTALSLGEPSLEVITYDRRMAEAARAHGLTVVQPGR